MTALVDLEGDADGRIHRGETQSFMQACGRLVARMGEQDVDRDIAAGIENEAGPAHVIARIEALLRQLRAKAVLNVPDPQEFYSDA